jgi:prostaglandin reductase 1
MPCVRPILVSLICASPIFRVVESRHPEYEVGIHVVGHFGWQTRTVVNADDPGAWIWLKKPYIIPDFDGQPLSLALGVLGMPGWVLLTSIMPVEVSLSVDIRSICPLL